MVLFFGLATTAMAYSIRDDATGGDCTQIGVWDAGTKTCTLATNLYNSTEGFTIDSDGITFDGNGHTITGGLYTPWGPGGVGVSLYYRTGVTIKNLNVVGFAYGIHLDHSNGNRLSNNTAQEFYSGIMLIFSNNNTVIRNTISGEKGICIAWWSLNNTIADNVLSGYVGIALEMFASGNILTGNTISGAIGVAIRESANANTIYNNNFLNSEWGILCLLEGANIFNLDMPVGGNYWNNYDTPEEGCNDANNDGFCDAPYFGWNPDLGFRADNADYLPWAKQDGWLTPEKMIDNVIAQINMLLGSASIREGTATSLNSTLNQASAQLEKGNIQATAQLLEAFIKQVQGQVNGGRISIDAAEDLIAATQQAINKLQ